MSKQGIQTEYGLDSCHKCSISHSSRFLCFLNSYQVLSNKRIGHSYPSSQTQQVPLLQNSIASSFKRIGPLWYAITFQQAFYVVFLCFCHLFFLDFLFCCRPDVGPFACLCNESIEIHSSLSKNIK